MGGREVPTISQLAIKLNVTEAQIKDYLALKWRKSFFADFTVTSGGLNMKTEILRAVLQNLIFLGQLPLSPSELEKI